LDAKQIVIEKWHPLEWQDKKEQEKEKSSILRD
jgi:hypothetical protein